MSDTEQEQEQAFEENPIDYNIPQTKFENEQKKIQAKKFSINDFTKKHPVSTALLAVLALVILILVIVLPATLIKPIEEQPVDPKCPDGKLQPRIDCLPDRNKLMQENSNLEATCKSRQCCWSSSPEQGGPNCAVPYNYGFRTFKLKEKTISSNWTELLRMNSPNSFARSDIANLEIKIEMQTDNRLRISVRIKF